MTDDWKFHEIIG